MPETRMKEMGNNKPTINGEELYDVQDWQAWSKKYVNPLLINGEYDLISDEPAPNVYLFPLFTELFCKQLIALSEKFDWTH